LIQVHGRIDTAAARACRSSRRLRGIDPDATAATDTGTTARSTPGTRPRTAGARFSQSVHIIDAAIRQRDVLATASHQRHKQRPQT
jgi:hypothetical protein